MTIGFCDPDKDPLQESNSKSEFEVACKVISLFASYSPPFTGLNFPPSVGNEDKVNVWYTGSNSQLKNKNMMRSLNKNFMMLSYLLLKLQN